MKLLVAAVGRLKRGPERELAERYRERAAAAGRAIGLRAVEVVEIAESQARRPQDRMAEEAGALSAAIPPGTTLIALDERGEAFSSAELAQRIAQWRDRGNPAAAFIIGGPDGLAESIRKAADLRLAFGPATWPHQLARIMLLEQLYRSVTILSGHPYHRPGRGRVKAFTKS